jgi:hypothetical protein
MVALVLTAVITLVLPQVLKELRLTTSYRNLVARRWVTLITVTRSVTLLLAAALAILLRLTKRLKRQV